MHTRNNSWEPSATLVLPAPMSCQTSRNSVENSLRTPPIPINPLIPINPWLLWSLPHPPGGAERSPVLPALLGYQDTQGHLRLPHPSQIFISLSPEWNSQGSAHLDRTFSRGLGRSADQERLWESCWQCLGGGTCVPSLGPALDSS